jgi:hypothetical protein
MLPEDERPGWITDMLAEIGPGLKKSSALAILERVRRYLPSSPRAQDADELEILLAFVTPYSLLDPNRGFEVVEPLIDQFNELSIAAITMNGFGNTYYKDGEFITDDDNPIASMANQLKDALGRLTLANFQRAKADADRVRPLNVRIQMHLAIARHAISGLEKDDEDDDYKTSRGIQL